MRFGFIFCFILLYSAVLHCKIKLTTSRISPIAVYFWNVSPAIKEGSLHYSHTTQTTATTHLKRSKITLKDDRHFVEKITVDFLLLSCAIIKSIFF